ncbi:MAG: serine/threonine protein kinase, partial [Bryobacteraceae bacterium]|nr:serine/threonine protein kinase [Bryobacteraceae bacterium]
MRRFGQYEVTGELGRGGMGIVFKGFDPVIRREVALKTIRLYDIDDVGERARMQERLEREAQSAGRLSHPNIVTIYQFGYEQVKPNETMAFIAMEYVPGRTLASLLGEGRPLQTQVVMSLLKQAAEAIDYAHAQGVIHRDIKPANLLVTPDARLKVTDFGVAKISAHTLTMTGTVLGSPFYMSPEQIRGEKVDARTDQYALGVVAFEAFGGRKPFDAETLSSLVYQIVHMEPPALELPDSEMARRVNPVLMRALAKSAEGRFGSCGEFVRALAGAIEEHGRRPAAVIQTPAARPVAPAAPVAPKMAAGEAMRAPVPVIPIPVPRAAEQPETVVAPAREMAAPKAARVEPVQSVAAKPAVAGLKLTLVAAGVV